MRTAGILLSVAYALMAGESTASAQARGVEGFDAAVTQYVALHRQVERHLPPQRDFVEADQLLAYSAALRDALCRARPEAREGDVFAPAAAELRQRTRHALRVNGIEARDLLREMRDDTEEGARAPVVNQPFSWALGNLIPAAVLVLLPALPDELQYRFVGTSLVLVDIHAGLVVDILRDALDVTTSE